MAPITTMETVLAEIEALYAARGKGRNFTAVESSRYEALILIEHDLLQRRPHRRNTPRSESGT